MGVAKSSLCVMDDDAGQSVAEGGTDGTALPAEGAGLVESAEDDA